MLLKLALRNVRRSVRDYIIYFITLTFGVAMFYAFNSLGSQQVLFDAEELAAGVESMFDNLSYFMNMFSLVIACVLGFLVLYSNGFLIRRRKREFGIYEIMGMSGGQVSRIIIYETVLIGLASLAAGLILGILAAQGLSFVTGALFGTTITNYQFVFSFEAFLGTVACFGAIFVLVAIFNTISVNRYQLVDLLHADVKNQKAPVRKTWVSLVIFIASIAALAFAYEQLIESEMIMMDDPRFLRATIFMLVGSLGFFYSLAGFAVAAITRFRGFYLKKLRPFTLRQITSRVNSAFLSLWAICVLLFFSITTFSTGMGLINVFVGDIYAANPYDASLRADIWYSASDAIEDEVEQGVPLSIARMQDMIQRDPEGYEEGQASNWDMAAALQAGSPELWSETIGAWAQINYYDVGSLDSVSFKDIAETIDTPEGRDVFQKFNGISGFEADLIVAPVNDVNATREILGMQPISLQPGQCTMINNTEMTEDVAKAFTEPRTSFSLGDMTLAFDGRIYDMQLEDSFMLMTGMVVVVPEDVVQAIKDTGAIPTYCYLNLMYAANGKTASENDRALETMIATVQPYSPEENEPAPRTDEIQYSMEQFPVTMATLATAMLTQSGGLRMLITYLALYIGLVFLLSTAAILAIQQLTTIVDSLPRYRMLWRLGADASMLNRSLFAQVLIYFLVPLGLAICHSACAISVLSDQLFNALGTSTFGPIMTCVLLVLVIYGGYMLITYFAGRNMLKPALQAK